MGRNADMENLSTRTQFAGDLASKTSSNPRKSNGQARHKINRYHISKTVSSVPGIAGLPITEKTKHGVIARMSEETKRNSV